MTCASLSTRVDRRRRAVVPTWNGGRTSVVFNSRVMSRIVLPLVLLAIQLLVAQSASYAQRGAQPTSSQTTTTGCPGQAMSVQATGSYTPRPVPEIIINGQPAPGAIWQPGERSYWHCHAGGQIMMLFDGAGRVQQRGQKARTLHKGDTEYAGPGVEHWHGATPDATAHFFQTSIGSGPTLWMEEVGRDDYLGNDVGISTRNGFLTTGIRKQPVQTSRPPLVR